MVGGPLVLAVLVATFAWSAPGHQLFERALTDADIRTLLPVLRAEADVQDRDRVRAEREATAREAKEGARAEVVARVAAGVVDPWEWLQEQSSGAAAPSTARYDADCSREWSASRRDVTAVFSFGVGAPAAWAAVAGGQVEAAPPAPASAVRPRGPGAEAITQQARAFYAAKGFEPEGARAPFRWDYLAPDTRVRTSVFGVKPAADGPACLGLASGPTIVLEPGPGSFPPASPLPTPPTGVANPLEQALDAAGLDDATYRSLKFQVTMARRDARAESGAAARPGAAGIPGPPDAEDGRAGHEVAVRRENVDVYRRFASELDPLLDRLERETPKSIS